MPSLPAWQVAEPRPLADLNTWRFRDRCYPPRLRSERSPFPDRLRHHYGYPSPRIGQGIDSFRCRKWQRENASGSRDSSHRNPRQNHHRPYMRPRAPSRTYRPFRSLTSSRAATARKSRWTTTPVYEHCKEDVDARARRVTLGGQPPRVTRRTVASTFLRMRWRPSRGITVAPGWTSNDLRSSTHRSM
jgi:hypothetical protein